MNLNNEKVLVVGAGGLLGSALVKELLLNGATVVAADLDTLRLTERLLSREIDVQKASVSIVELNLTEAGAVADFFNNASGITGVVNSSYPRNKSYGNHFYDVNLSDFNENLTLNLGSSFLLMQQCAKYFERNKTPLSLVNISSIYGVVPPKFEIYENTKMTMPIEYAAIKSSLIHLSKYVTKYVADSRFRVNLVSPGGIFDYQPEDFLKAYKGKTFGKGMLDVNDVLGAIVFLLSSMSSFVNGQNIIVDDGFSLY